MAHGAVLSSDGHGKCWLIDGGLLGYMKSYAPSADWEQGGPIIDREDIHWGFGTKDGNKVVIASKFGHHVKPLLGPTPLIAAMRCFVESRLGDEVEIPAAFAIQERR